MQCPEWSYLQNFNFKALCQHHKRKITASQHTIPSWEMSGSLCSLAFVCPTLGQNGSSARLFYASKRCSRSHLAVSTHHVHKDVSGHFPILVPRETFLPNVEQTWQGCPHQPLQALWPSVNLKGWSDKTGMRHHLFDCTFAYSVWSVRFHMRAVIKFSFLLLSQSAPQH